MTDLTSPTPQFDILGVWPEGRKAMMAVDVACAEEEAPERLLELVRLWCSVRNGCEFCVAMHRSAAIGCGVELDSVDRLANGELPKAISAGERAALQLAGALTGAIDARTVDDATREVREHFSPRQVAVLIYVIAAINAWNRIAIAGGFAV
jgi:AhpD family alkylhydroperoxidase